MPIESPASATEIDEKIRTDVSRVVVGSKPFVINSFWGGIISGLANALFDYYEFVQDAIRESLPDKAIVKLPRWAAIHKILTLGSTVSSGFIDVRGDLGTAVAVGKIWNSGDGVRYSNTIGGATAAVSIAIPAAGLTRAGSVVTVTLAAAHLLSGTEAGYELKIVGSDEALYNLNPLPDLQITGPTTLTFTAAAGASPAGGGTLELADITQGRATITVKAETPGTAGNQISGAQLTLVQPVSGLRDVAHVTAETLSGGLEQEETEALRDRYLEEVQNPTAHFNDAEIISTAKLINGVTRVFVFRRVPTLGTVTIYFVRDGETDLIPTATDVANVLTALTGGTVDGVEFPGIHPANMTTSDVVVAAPVAEVVNFVFDSLVPDSAEMRTAVTANLGQLFEERVEVGVDLKETAIWNAIFATVDATGVALTDFSYTTPAAGDVTIDAAHPAAEIPKLGTVTYP